MNEIKRIISTFPMAMDQWAMVIVLIHVLGHAIPWYVWVILGIEGVVALMAMKGARITWDRQS